MNRMTFALLAPLVLIGCGDDDPSGPSAEELAGIYEATQIVYFEDGTQRNLLEEGAFFDITLHAQGVTEGELFIPAIGGGSPLTGDLAGTWSADGTTITFEQTVPTFVDHLPFIWDEDDGGVLGTSIYTEDGRLDIRLTRTGFPAPEV